MTTEKKPVKRTRRRAAPIEKVGAEEVRRVTITLGQSGNTTDEKETIETDVHMFITEPAYVRINAGVTKNMGNFESLRVDVSISTPCYREVIDEVFDSMAVKVASLLDNEVDEYLGAKGD